jgi:hypothetical protein
VSAGAAGGLATPSMAVRGWACKRPADRLAAWVEVEDGAVVFALPDDVSAGNEAPWGQEAYVRVRNKGGVSHL